MNKLTIHRTTSQIHNTIAVGVADFEVLDQPPIASLDVLACINIDEH